VVVICAANHENPLGSIWHNKHSLTVKQRFAVLPSNWTASPRVSFGNSLHSLGEVYDFTGIDIV
jgi:hypothetical protein